MCPIHAISQNEPVEASVNIIHDSESVFPSMHLQVRSRLAVQYDCISEILWLNI